MLQRLIMGGVLAPSLVVSLAHDDAALDQTLTAVDDMLGVYARALEDGVDRHLEGQPCLAHATGSGQRHQPRRLQEGPDLPHLTLPPDQRSQRARDPAGRVAAAWGRRAGAIGPIPVAPEDSTRVVGLRRDGRG